MTIPLDGCKAHSLESLKKCALLSASKPAKKCLGSQHSPLIAIDPDHIVLDELHLLLRIMDILIRNLILEMVHLDIANKQRASGPSASHLERLVSTIRECRISFSVWEKDVDRNPTGVYDWTSLTGADKKSSSMLPEKLPEILPPDITPTVVQIWKVCHIVLDNFRNSNSQNPPPPLITRLSDLPHTDTCCNIPSTSYVTSNFNRISKKLLSK